MDSSKHLAAQKLYLYLAALFITSLVVSNLIFQKFFYWYPFDWEIMGNSLFELSVGILPYPITFLVTDLISEIFGKKAANRVVVAGIFASFFSMGILLLAGVVPALPNSPIDDATFNKVFALSPIAVLASMMAYLFAQFIDTFTVVGLLCVFGVLPWDAFLGLLISGVVFKILVALIDTPLLYLSVNCIRSYYKLEINEEIKL